MMSPKTQGWMLLVAAIGMLFGLIALDISNLETWDTVTTPQFVGKLLGNLASVITAFVGGKIIPENRSIYKRTRASDSSIGYGD